MNNTNGVLILLDDMFNFENLIQSHWNGPYAWGIQSLKIDQEILSLGKFALLECRAVLPDGTSVNIPEDVPPPPAIEIDENLKNETLFLALPLKRHGVADIVEKDNVTNHLARYVIEECELGDSNAGSQSRAKLNIGQLRLRFILEHETRGEYACLALAHIKEVRTAQVVLDDEFIPPNLNCHAVPKLSGYIKELLGLLRFRGEALALRATETGRGLAEISDFMLLQTVNRFEPLILHLTEISGLHPESFYREIVQIAGEFATFTHDNKRPIQFPPYIHEDLQATFKPVMDDLRQAFNGGFGQNVFAIPLVYRGPGRGVGLYVAPMAETIVRELLNQAHFVLAVNAQVPNEVLHHEFPKQVKIGAVEKIERMTRRSLPGVRVQVTRAVPRQIPIHSGFTYFDLDQKN
ncbi:type VI secretion protein, VC_A0114 family, partial [Candidatus Thiomargarita nelsonii]